jgi:hypothetical protein
LSIWTRHLRGIEYIEEFQSTSCSVDDTFTAVRVAAGHAAIEVQIEVSKHDSVVITGANPDVGIVGWLTGGGHGPLTQTYGMGVDHLLEATIVTPNGQVLLANPCQDKDLFFAIRGGGGGTYGIVTEIVVKTYPTPKTTLHTFRVTSLGSNTTTEFYDFLGFIHANLQRLKEGGMQGYYYIGGPPIVPTLSFTWTFMLFDAPTGTIEHLMQPILAYLTPLPHLFTHSQETKHSTTYLAIYNGTYTNEPVATSGSAIGSRLLRATSLTNPPQTARLLASIGPSANASNPNVTFSPSLSYDTNVPNTPSYSHQPPTPS